MDPSSVTRAPVTYVAVKHAQWGIDCEARGSAGRRSYAGSAVAMSGAVPA
jgi:hypothetical protein